jgi:hypothetical protein
VSGDEHDPRGPYPMWQSRPPCGDLGCACAVPTVPCRTFEGHDDMDWCPCCGWNRAAHTISARARRERSQLRLAQRPVVARVRLIRGGVLRGLWLAECGPSRGHFLRHDDAVRHAARWAAQPQSGAA